MERYRLFGIMFGILAIAVFSSQDVSAHHINNPEAGEYIHITSINANEYYRSDDMYVITFYANWSGLDHSHSSGGSSKINITDENGVDVEIIPGWPNRTYNSELTFDTTFQQMRWENPTTGNYTLTIIDISAEHSDQLDFELIINPVESPLVIFEEREFPDHKLPPKIVEIQRIEELEKVNAEQQNTIEELQSDINSLNQRFDESTKFLQNEINGLKNIISDIQRTLSSLLK